MIISISVSKEKLDFIDKYCSSIGASRSKFIIVSALEKISEKIEESKEKLEPEIPSPKIQSPEEESKKKVFSKILNRYV